MVGGLDQILGNKTVSQYTFVSKINLRQLRKFSCMTQNVLSFCNLKGVGGEILELLVLTDQQPSPDPILTETKMKISVCK